MINFLSPEAKSDIRREYWMRVLSVWGFLLSAVAFSSVALLAPTYLLLVRQLDALASEVAQMAEDVADTYQTDRATLESAQVLVSQLGVSVPGPTALVVLREVRAAQTGAITLSSFSYTHNGTVVETVGVHGVAATREALVQFSATLERNPLFVHASVPVSDLAEDRDLPFTLTIIVAKAST